MEQGDFDGHVSIRNSGTWGSEFAGRKRADRPLGAGSGWGEPARAVIVWGLMPRAGGKRAVAGSPFLRTSRARDLILASAGNQGKPPNEKTRENDSRA
jgi:hypothetical protein